MNCIFCKIINKEISSNIIYEDNLVCCILDTFPDSNGHLLIIPKEHTVDIDTINEETLIHIMKIVKDMKKLLEDKLHCDGLTLIQNNGDVQEVKHFHLHLKPYYKNEQVKLEPTVVYNILKNSYSR